MSVDGIVHLRRAEIRIPQRFAAIEFPPLTKMGKPRAKGEKSRMEK
jgi:hypothetical protein